MEEKKLNAAKTVIDFMGVIGFLAQLNILLSRAIVRAMCQHQLRRISTSEVTEIDVSPSWTLVSIIEP